MGRPSHDGPRFARFVIAVALAALFLAPPAQGQGEIDALRAELAKASGKARFPIVVKIVSQLAHADAEAGLKLGLTELDEARKLQDRKAEADILVAAIGRAAFITRDFVKPGATVIDVGINQLEDAAIVERLFPEGSKRREAFARRGSILVGDVHPEVAEVAGALSPVPGGVGPLTIAMLLKNTVTAAEARCSKSA